MSPMLQRTSPALALVISVIVAVALSSTACTFDVSGIAPDENIQNPDPCVDNPGQCPDVPPDAQPDIPPDVPADWYDPMWTYRRLLTIPAAEIAELLADFPVLVHLRDAELLDKAQPSGNDISFVSLDGQTVFAHELEAYDETDGELVAWVNLPTLSSTEDNQFYIYYGNLASGDQQNPAQVWDSAYQGVWHLSEPAVDESVTQMHRDSSGYENHGTQSGNELANGRIAGAQDFDGTNDQINISNPTSFVLGDADCTVSAWIRTNTTRDRGIVIKSPPNGHEPRDKLFGINHTQNRLGVDHGWVGYANANTTVNDDNWHHVAWVQRANASGNDELWQLWVDGSMENQRSYNTDTDDADHTLRIGGGSPSSYFSDTFRGRIDEVRISHTDRSPAWIQTSYQNQLDPASFHSIGAEQAL